MALIIILKGLPASGKTFFSKRTQAQDPSFIRVDKDELRSMLFNDIYSKENENLIIKVRNMIIENVIENNGKVIVDDTNLHPRHIVEIKEIAQKYNETNVKIIKVPISLKRAIENDSKRERPVGAEVITNMFVNFIKGQDPQLEIYDDDDLIEVDAAKDIDCQFCVNFDDCCVCGK